MGGAGVHGRPWLHTEFKASRGYLRLSQNKAGVEGQKDDSDGKDACLKPDSLALIPGTHMAEGRTDSCKLSSAFHMCTRACTHLRE